MPSIKINPYFIEAYLTAGAAKDDFVFDNCPAEFLTQAEQLLSKDSSDAISCVIKITENTEKQLTHIISKTDDPYIKSIIYRDFVAGLVMQQMLQKTAATNIKSRIDQDLLNQGIEAILSGDFEAFKELSSCMPFQFDIESYVRKIKTTTEINFLLENTTNVGLQRSINNFISSRNPYVVKVFTNAPNLPVYYDQAGNLIQDPHDYMSRDVNQFITQIEPHPSM